MVGLAGGFEEVAAEQQIPPVAVDELSEGLPWDVTVESAGLFTELSPARLHDEANHWLVVVAEVALTADQTRHDMGDILVVPAGGIDGIDHEDSRSGALPDTVQPTEVRLIRDGSYLASLHPGLPERVAFMWERAGDGPPPATVEVVIVSKAERVSVLSGQLEWLDFEPRGQVTVTLQDRREEPLRGRREDR